MTVFNGWKRQSLLDIAYVNPTETLRKGEESSYVAMERLVPFQRKIVGKVTRPYSGGMKFRNGDTLVARITPCLENGKTAFVDCLDDGQVGFGSTEFIVIRQKKGISDSRFLFYFATSPSFRSAAIKSMTGTSGRQRVQTDLIASRPFHFPSLPEQEAIAAVLSSLDEKIELLRRQNESLEKIAQTLFKEWFVEFNFPDKNSRPYKANGGKMIDSELGPIPVGWRAAPIGSHVRCVGGSTPSTSEPTYWNGGSVAFLTPKDMSGLSSPVILGTERYVTGLGVKQISSGVLPEGIVVLSSRAPIGYLAITAIPVVINQGIIGMICDGDLPSSFVFDWVRLNLDRIKANAGGSTFAEINKSSFRAIKAVIPAREVLSDYSNVTSWLIQKVLANGQHCTTLSQLRDLLLPKLMSGELRVGGT